MQCNPCTCPMPSLLILPSFLVISLIECTCMKPSYDRIKDNACFVESMK